MAQGDSCDMCGGKEEIVAKAVYRNHKQQLCNSCLRDGIPKYTVVYQKKCMEFKDG